MKNLLNILYGVLNGIAILMMIAFITPNWVIFALPFAPVAILGLIVVLGLSLAVKNIKDGNV